MKSRKLSENHQTSKPKFRRLTKKDIEGANFSDTQFQNEDIVSFNDTEDSAQSDARSGIKADISMDVELKKISDCLQTSNKF